MKSLSNFVFMTLLHFYRLIFFLAFQAIWLTACGSSDEAKDPKQAAALEEIQKPWWQTGNILEPGLGEDAHDAKNNGDNASKIAPKPPEFPKDLPKGIREGALLKSPFSDFRTGFGGRTQGDAVFDPQSGKYFQVP
jgi:hypothetical protein